MWFFSIDATNNNRLGRYVNDEVRKFANCYAKVQIIDGRPCVLLLACRDLIIGEELRYDYGGGDLPWRQVSLCIYIPIIITVTDTAVVIFYSLMTVTSAVHHISASHV